MDRFNRQIRIAGWNQDRIGASRVAVVDRGWLGTFTAWGLASLGVGEIVWIGTPRPATGRLAHWFLADPCPFSGCSIFDYPFDVEYGPELGWACSGKPPDALLCCSPSPDAHDICGALAQRHGYAYRAGNAIARRKGSTSPTHADDGEDDPIVAMVSAALLVDAVRAIVSPLRDNASAARGDLFIQPSPVTVPLTAVVVGIGGIGVYAATLAAALGMEMTLLDFDRVEATNLNRQGLFGAADVDHRAWKAIAAKEALARLFPEARVAADVRRVDETFADTLALVDATVVLSAVDNARTRLILQSATKTTGIPLVQAGTDVFAADCYTQTSNGPSIDAQMHGALSQAAAREQDGRIERAGGCGGTPSYVVPGMLAAGLMMYRALQVAAGRRDLPPIHWRSGYVPMEHRSTLHDFALAPLDI